MRSICLLLGMLAAFTSYDSSAKSTVYFLSVGSSRYLEPLVDGDHGFQRLDGARNGATALSERLSEGGARFGISLTSPQGSIVGLADFNHALDDILQRVRADKAPDPILLVYIAAHGISDGFAWNHFSVPGDLTYRGDADKLSPDQLAEKAINAATLVAYLNKAHIHYLLIIDTCYEGKAPVFQSPVLSATASQNIGDIAKALRFANEFHQGDPVLFSTIPGTTVPVAPDPTDPSNNSMGPLARRLIMLIDTKAAARAGISIGEIMHNLQSASFDTLTQPAVTNAIPARWWASVLYAHGAKIGMFDERIGTATMPRLCCLAEHTRETSIAVPVHGMITLRGAPGEFITGGKEITLRGGITLERAGPTSLTLSVPDQEGGWSLEFTSAEPFALGLYAKAERAGFASHGRPGISISGHAHGCNDVGGQFDIISLPSQQGGILSIRFAQRCDDVAAPLIGQVQVQLP